MQVKIEESWRSQLQEEFDKPYFARLAAFVREEYRTQRVCPVNGDLFRVFNLCPFDRVRVVILGQDPTPTRVSTTESVSRCPTACRFPARCKTSSAKYTTTQGAPSPHRDGWNVGSHKASCR